MEKESIASLFNLFASMKEHSTKLKQAIENKDIERLEKMKKEILELNKSADRIL